MDKHVIEVEARFTDNVTAGAKKADKALDSLEKKAKKSTSVKMNFNPNTTTKVVILKVTRGLILVTSFFCSQRTEKLQE